jgi:glycosyltransferase involved in cell wall biosynthesis
MRILFVALTGSAHTARWISQLRDTNWDIHLFDPNYGLLHPDLTRMTIHTGWRKEVVPAGAMVRYRWPFTRGRFFMQRRFPRLWRLIVPEGATMLPRLIERLQPDCIHSLGMQIASYHLYEAREILGGVLPVPWIHSSWGSDYFYYWQFPEHQNRIRQVLETCDYLISDCERDIRLAREYGFGGETLGVFPTGGGYPVEEMKHMRQSGSVSRRRTIAVKGLQHQVGRALVALQALRKCANILQGYKVLIYQAHPETRREAARLSSSLPIPVEVIPRSPAEEIWKLFGEARMSIGVSISDGVANSMLESMIMGALPIQTDPGGATSEWIEDGVNGLIIPPDDPDQIANAIKRAVEDDELVDSAAERNLDLTSKRIDVSVIQPRVVSLYQHVVREGKNQTRDARDAAR